MEIRVRRIHNEADYERTLSEVEALMDAEPGTPRGERLDVLVTLVEAYEARRWQIGNPGESTKHSD
jgi:HTH-type transcriptional regulator / antitoxin HigA